MKRHLAAIHPQGEGTVIYNALVVCAHLWNFWLQFHFPSLLMGVPKSLSSDAPAARDHRERHRGNRISPRPASGIDQFYVAYAT